MSQTQARSLFDRSILQDAIVASFRKLDPRTQIRKSVMFPSNVGSNLTTVLWLRSLTGTSQESTLFILDVRSLALVHRALSTTCGAIAEGHGKAQAASLAQKPDLVMANLLTDLTTRATKMLHHIDLKIGDRVICSCGEQIPADGEVVEGVASVDESAITGESAPVVRESGGDRRR